MPTCPSEMKYRLLDLVLALQGPHRFRESFFPDVTRYRLIALLDDYRKFGFELISEDMVPTKAQEMLWQYLEGSLSLEQLSRVPQPECAYLARTYSERLGLPDSDWAPFLVKYPYNQDQAYAFKDFQEFLESPCRGSKDIGRRVAQAITNIMADFPVYNPKGFSLLATIEFLTEAFSPGFKPQCMEFIHNEEIPLSIFSKDDDPASKALLAAICG